VCEEWRAVEERRRLARVLGFAGGSAAHRKRPALAVLRRCTPEAALRGGGWGEKWAACGEGATQRGAGGRHWHGGTVGRAGGAASGVCAIEAGAVFLNR
jgi:hypothetical protein